MLGIHGTGDKSHDNGVSGEFTLNKLRAGEKATITCVEGEAAERSKLCSLGILPGAEIEADAASHGKCRLRVNGSSLAIDDCVACNITCASPHRAG